MSIYLLLFCHVRLYSISLIFCLLPSPTSLFSSVLRYSLLAPPAFLIDRPSFVYCRTSTLLAPYVLSPLMYIILCRLTFGCNGGGVKTRRYVIATGSASLLCIRSQVSFVINYIISEIIVYLPMQLSKEKKCFLKCNIVFHYSLAPVAISLQWQNLYMLFQQAKVTFQKAYSNIFTIRLHFTLFHK
jgi:hypothetical protein